MNIADSMARLQGRLIERRAQPRTIQMLDKYILIAQQAGGSEHTSELRVLQRLMRAPEAAKDTAIYNDLAGVEEVLEGVREQNQREREILDARPIPKPKKFYKESNKPRKQ